MKKTEQNLSQRIIDLLREQGIIVSMEQAEQLLKSNHSPTEMPAADNISIKQTGNYQLINGYKVYVEYESLTEEEMKMKKSIVASIVSNAMNEAGNR